MNWLALLEGVEELTTAILNICESESNTNFRHRKCLEKNTNNITESRRAPKEIRVDKVKIEKVHLTCTLQQSGFIRCHVRNRLFLCSSDRTSSASTQMFYYLWVLTQCAGFSCSKASLLNHCFSLYSIHFHLKHAAQRYSKHDICPL